MNNYLRVTATYTDDDGPNKTAEAVTQGMVLDREATNELPAFADDATADLAVQENTPAGQNIGGPFTATDDDDTTLTYVLGGADASSFVIVDTTGQIQTKEVLDYENTDNKTSYAVTVEVHDGKDPWGNAETSTDDSIEVTIHVTDMVVPDAPDQPTVNATPGAAAGLTVTWTAIEATTTAPVDGYDVQYREKDDQNPPAWLDANVTVTGTTATITGLAYSTTYEVEVRSKNAGGTKRMVPNRRSHHPGPAERVPLARHPYRR